MSTSIFAATQLTPAVRKVLVNTYLLLSMSLVVSGRINLHGAGQYLLRYPDGGDHHPWSAHWRCLFLLMAVRNSPIALPVMFAFSRADGGVYGTHGEYLSG